MADPPPAQDQPARAPRQPLSAVRLVGSALLVGAVIAAVLFGQPPEKKSPHQAPEGGEAPPELEIADAVISRYKMDGVLEYRLRSPLIRQHADPNLTTLEAPDLTLYKAPDPPWEITARRGTIFALDREGEEVLLEEDVRMTRRYPDGRHFTLQTPSMRVYPDREYAETSRDVMITTHAGRTRAVGLKGNLDQGLLELFSTDAQRVHTVILPDQFK